MRERTETVLSAVCYRYNRNSALAHRMCETVRERDGLRAIEVSVQCLNKMPGLIE